MSEKEFPDRFANIPVDAEARILTRAEIEVEGLPSAIIESSRGDGAYMESLIFVSADVADKDDESLEALVRTTGKPKADSAMTINRDPSGYTFINYNFDFED